MVVFTVLGTWWDCGEDQACLSAGEWKPEVRTSHRCSMAETEKSFTELPRLQYLIVWISLLISKQTNCPAYIGFLFKVLGETAGAVPAFVSKWNQIKMNAGVSMGEKRSHGDSQGLEEDVEAGISIPLDRPTLEGKRVWWLGGVRLAWIFLTPAGLGSQIAKL